MVEGRKGLRGMMVSEHMTTYTQDDDLVVVFGGSGFVGRYVVRLLARRGYRIRVATRRPELSGHLQPLGGVGQIHMVRSDIRDYASVAHALAGAKAVVNLCGVLVERGKNRFDDVHDIGAGTVARAAALAGVERFVHMSSICPVDSDSRYARSKMAGEAHARQAFPDVVVLRPSVVFGAEDRFFNRFAGLASVSPIVPMVGASTRFQPVFVGDVAKAVAVAVDGQARPGAVHELGGPDVMTFRALLEKMLHVIRRKRILLPIPFSFARMIAVVTQMLPDPLLTLDQVELLGYDNMVSGVAVDEGRTLQGLGIDPCGMDAVLPTYLSRFRPAGALVSAG